MLAYQVAILSLFNHNHLLTQHSTLNTQLTHSLTHLLNTQHYTTLDTITRERLFDHHFASLVNPYQYTIHTYLYIHIYRISIHHIPSLNAP